MEIKKQGNIVKCDMPGCKNLSSYVVTGKSFISGNICFCEKCMSELYSFYSKQVTPKSPVNMLNKNGKK